MSIIYTYARSNHYDDRVRFLIIHYTAEDFKTSLAILTKKLSSHYLIPLNSIDDPSYPFKKTEVFNLLDETHRAWHAGVSAFQDRVNLNDSSIGIEVVNLVKSIDHFLPYPNYQIEMLSKLCKNILQRYPTITPERVLGHADIAFNRKSGPGPLFPWHTLYEHGIGAWYDKDDYVFYKELIDSGALDINKSIECIQKYGYVVDQTRSEEINLHNMIRAFQMHFRPSLYDGCLDSDTAAIIFSLYKKYRLTQNSIGKLCGLDPQRDRHIGLRGVDWTR